LDAFKIWFKGLDWEALKGDKSGSQQQARVTSIHAILRPFLLRRLKADVALKLPSKKEVLLSVGASRSVFLFILNRPFVLSPGMSAMQKQYYRMVLEKDAEKLSAVTKNKTSLLNSAISCFVARADISFQL
jgi:SNF2 family DNA or RNA helicase